MNNEKILYEYIKMHGNCIYTNYEMLAEELGCGISTVKKYKNILVADGYISCRCKVINNSKKLILSIIKEN